MPDETASRPEERRSRQRVDRRVEVPDLQTQLEEILNTVWKAEANWRLDDRLDMALKVRRTS